MIAALVFVRRYWLALLVVLVALAFAWQMQLTASAESEAAAVKVDAADTRRKAAEDLQRQSEATVDRMRKEAAAKELALAGLRILRAEDRRQLDEAKRMAAAAKGTARDGPIAPVVRDYLRSIRKPN